MPLARLSRRIRHEIRLLLRSVTAQRPRTICQRTSRIVSYWFGFWLVVVLLASAMSNWRALRAAVGPLVFRFDSWGVEFVYLSEHTSTIAFETTIASGRWSSRTVWAWNLPASSGFGAIFSAAIVAGMIMTGVCFWLSLGQMEKGVCWRCKYDLRGIANRRCPECGAVALRPKIAPLSEFVRSLWPQKRS